MKTRMRTDLRAALKEGRTDEARLIRALVAALDNAEAPPLPPLPPSSEPDDRHRFHQRSAEIERHCLSPAQVCAVLLAEIEERERAAKEMSRVSRPQHAIALRAEALLARRYIG